MRLRNAIEKGVSEDISAILDERPDASRHIMWGRGEHPLADAARLEDREKAEQICKLLIERGADVHQPTEEAGRTALMLMARYRVFHRSVAKLLSASVNDVDRDGKTALVFAVTNSNLFSNTGGNFRITKALLELGADVMIRDVSGQTALDLAEDEKRNEKIIDLLHEQVQESKNKFSSKAQFSASSSHEFPTIIDGDTDDEGGLTSHPTGDNNATKQNRAVSTKDLTCLVRGIFSKRRRMTEAEAVAELARRLDHHRVGKHIRLQMQSAIRTAARRGIVKRSGADLTLATRGIKDYDRGALEKLFLASLRRRVWCTREEALMMFTRYLGFSRQGAVITRTGRSTVRSLVRRGKLEVGEGGNLRRTG